MHVYYIYGHFGCVKKAPGLTKPDTGVPKVGLHKAVPSPTREQTNFLPFPSRTSTQPQAAPNPRSSHLLSTLEPKLSTYIRTLVAKWTAIFAPTLCMFLDLVSQQHTLVLRTCLRTSHLEVMVPCHHRSGLHAPIFPHLFMSPRQST